MNPAAAGMVTCLGNLRSLEPAPVLFSPIRKESHLRATPSQPSSTFHLPPHLAFFRLITSGSLSSSFSCS